MLTGVIKLKWFSSLRFLRFNTCSYKISCVGERRISYFDLFYCFMVSNSQSLWETIMLEKNNVVCCRTASKPHWAIC
ncbi:uncharacterized protein LOC143249230 isoform X3 [Tachypleus tridentatus]|uniref:uncharacterized protein LOC143249230 isoform X3 n=1 Tax=Tachypleus tridentatus TaxID=6853 RepID=UPI003FD67B94